MPPVCWFMFDFMTWRTKLHSIRDCVSHVSPRVTLSLSSCQWRTRFFRVCPLHQSGSTSNPWRISCSTFATSPTIRLCMHVPLHTANAGSQRSPMESTKVSSVATSWRYTLPPLNLPTKQRRSMWMRRRIIYFLSVRKSFARNEASIEGVYCAKYFPQATWVLTMFIHSLWFYLYLCHLYRQSSFISIGECILSCSDYNIYVLYLLCWRLIMWKHVLCCSSMSCACWSQHLGPCNGTPYLLWCMWASVGKMDTLTTDGPLFVCQAPRQKLDEQSACSRTVLVIKIKQCWRTTILLQQRTT